MTTLTSGKLSKNAFVNQRSHYQRFLDGLANAVPQGELLKLLIGYAVRVNQKGDAEIARGLPEGPHGGIAEVHAADVRRNVGDLQFEFGDRVIHLLE